MYDCKEKTSETAEPNDLRRYHLRSTVVYELLLRLQRYSKLEAEAQQSTIGCCAWSDIWVSQVLNIRRTSAEISSNSPVVHVGEEVCRLGGRLISSKRPAMSTRTTALSEAMGRGCLAGSLMRIFKYLRLGYLRANGTVEPGVDRMDW